MQKNTNMLKDRLIRLSGVRYSKKEWYHILLPHIIAVVVFLGVAAWYCKPVFEDKVLMQEDVMQWRAMAQNSFQYRELHGHFPLWSNGMFSGMPAFQIAMDGRSVNLPSFAYNVLTLWLAKPLSFFFLACISFYFLAGVLRINPYIGILGALCYAYATYNPVIVAVGHETKMQTIALIPAYIGSLILIFERKHWQGMALTALCMSMMISFGHMQIVYYAVLTGAILFVNYVIRWTRERDLKHIYQAALMAGGACIIGILCNSIVLFTTYDSSKETTRGGSELTDDKGSNYTDNGLSESAAFDFSMYRSEPLVMLVPDIFGGSTDREMPEDRSKAVQVQNKMPKEVSQLIGEDGPQYYWGGVGSLFSGPPYSGAIICFLALAGLFLLDNRHKWWMLAACALTIMMSWGSYFQHFNSFLLKYLPAYNKFRAPSMILVVPTFLFCMMAVMTLQKIWQRVEWDGEGRIILWRKYRLALLAMVGVFGILLALYAGYDYRSAADANLLHEAAVKGNEALRYMQAFVEGLRDDRRGLFLHSIFRSFLYILGAALLIGWYIKRKVHAGVLVAGIGVLAFVDLMGMDLLYLNSDNYQEKKTYQENFAASDVDKAILQDTDYYRVLDIRDSVNKALSYGAMTAYYHHSIGGYHAAKLRIYEDLINHQLFNYPNCSPVINMLNTKYIIRQGKAGEDTVCRNPGSLGPVWFVKNLQFVPTPNAVMNGLTHLHPRDTAILFTADRDKVFYDPDPDSSGTIELVKNDNDVITYRSESASDRFAVFSEIYYARGWRAWIDTREVPIIRTNYVLRGLSVPAGKHMIRFIFRPASYYLGRQVQYLASILLVLIMIGAIVVALHDHGIDVLVLGRPLLKLQADGGRRKPAN